jgi:hypothetical protein
MTRDLSSKVRVVLSLLLVLTLAVTNAQQNILEKKVSINFQDVRFSEVLQEIEKQAHVHFIYSSNIVEPEKKITYSGHTTLAEVFTRLGHEMHLEFKTQNQYVIVKKGTGIPSPPTLTIPAPTIETIVKENVSQPEQIRHARTVTENTSIDLSTQIHRKYLRKLDSLNLQNARLKLSTQLQQVDRTTKFYAAAGLYVNDFSGGLELHAGIRPLYGVFNSGLSEGKYLRMGFGLGTNIHVAGKVRVSPIYIFSTIKEVSSAGISSINEHGYIVNVQQHQLKLMFEYPFAKNFYAKLGPSFNVMNLNFKQQPDPTVYYTRSQSRTYSYPGPQNSPGSGFYSTNVQHSNVASPEVRYDAIKSWIGFEAGIYYSLNFSKNR